MSDCSESEEMSLQLFSSVIGPEGMLRNKTRILVTNELSFLNHSNLIVVMKGERIERRNERRWGEFRWKDRC